MLKKEKQSNYHFAAHGRKKNEEPVEGVNKKKEVLAHTQV